MDQAECKGKPMPKFALTLTLGREKAPLQKTRASLANDNPTREQFLFEQCIAREIGEVTAGCD